MRARDDIAFLVGSECRVDSLLALREGPLGPSAIARRVSCARETAQRNLGGFVERNWVTKDGGRYRLTVAGELVLDTYERLEFTVESASRLTTFLTHVDGALEDVPATLLSEQCVTSAGGEDPHAPINRWLEVIGEEPVDEYYGIAGIVSRLFNEAAERIIGPETEMELIIDESVLETSRTQYPDALQLAYDLERFTLYVSPDSIDFGLCICNGHAWLAAYDELGNIVASVDGDDERFVEWARGVYERHRSDARVSTPESEQQLSA